MTDFDVRLSISLTTPPEEVWRIVGEGFADVGVWATGIRHSGALTTVDGEVDGRSCEIPGFGQTHESLIEFDAASRSLAYTVSAKRLPSFVGEITNRWSIVPAPGGGSEVSVHLRGRASGLAGALATPMMRRKFRSTMRATLADLKHFAETGQVSTAKRSALLRASRGAA